MLEMAILETQIFKNFWGSMPPEPPRKLAHLAKVASPPFESSGSTPAFMGFSSLITLKFGLFELHLMLVHFCINSPLILPHMFRTLIEDSPLPYPHLPHALEFSPLEFQITVCSMGMDVFWYYQLTIILYFEIYTSL